MLHNDKGEFLKILERTSAQTGFPLRLLEKDYYITVVLSKINEEKGKNYGYDANKDEYVADMVKTGIIDPLKVARTALENAVSVSAILLTTEAAIADKPEPRKIAYGDHEAGMPGM